MSILQPGDMYARQSTLGLSAPSRAVVVGCGGVGAWVAWFLALAGTPRLVLFDGDTVSTHNLNRLPVTLDAVGKVKSEALAALITAYRPDCEVEARGHFQHRLKAHKEKLQGASIVCATDSLKSRRQVYEAYVELGNSRDYRVTIPQMYVECGADGLNSSVSFYPPDVETPLEQHEGYTTVPVFIGPCVIAASIVCYYVLRGSMPSLVHQVVWDERSVELQLRTLRENATILGADDSDLPEVEVTVDEDGNELTPEALAQAEAAEAAAQVEAAHLAEAVETEDTLLRDALG